MPALIESLKVSSNPSRVREGLWGGLNVIHSLGSVASEWPEGRSVGLMKTNPSLCCLGNRPER